MHNNSLCECEVKYISKPLLVVAIYIQYGNKNINEKYCPLVT